MGRRRAARKREPARQRDELSLPRRGGRVAGEGRAFRVGIRLPPQPALALYPNETNLRMYNLLDSHDTARFLYEADGDKARLRLATALQMTFPGSPAIFYGDEIGLSGPNDPGCRMAMQWDAEQQDERLLRWYRRLIQLPLASDSLTDGDFHTVLADDAANVYAFSRAVPGEQTLVVLHAGTAHWRGQLPIPDWAREFAAWTLCCQTAA